MKRVVYASFEDAMTLVRKAKQKKIAYSYWELEELSKCDAETVAKSESVITDAIQQKFQTVKNFEKPSVVERFLKNPTKVTFFLEKAVDLKV